MLYAFTDQQLQAMLKFTDGWADLKQCTPNLWIPEHNEKRICCTHERPRICFYALPHSFPTCYVYFCGQAISNSIMADNHVTLTLLLKLKLTTAREQTSIIQNRLSYVSNKLQNLFSLKSLGLL